jgi:hypothetical protein
MFLNVFFHSVSRIVLRYISTMILEFVKNVKVKNQNLFQLATSIFVNKNHKTFNQIFIKCTLITVFIAAKELIKEN